MTVYQGGRVRWPVTVTPKTNSRQKNFNSRKKTTLIHAKKTLIHAKKTLIHYPCYKRQAVQDNETTRGSGVDKLQERFENTTTNEEYNNVDYDFVAK